MGDSAEQPVVSIPDGGACQFLGYDENDLCRTPNGRLAGVNKSVLLCWRKRGQRTTIFLSGIWRWFHDSSAQQNWISQDC